MKVVFVTGTDTGVGKTIVTAALASAAAQAGHRVHVVKPAQTGVTTEEPSDVEVIARLSGVEVTEGVRLRDPLAPETAARLEGVALPSLQLQRDLVLSRDADVVVVEGAGGVLVRLGRLWDLRDLAAAVAREADVEVVVVARAGLGTLNHTTLTVDALRLHDLPVLGVVIGAAPADPDLAETQNVHDLPAMTGVPLLGAVPSGAGDLDPAAFAAAAPSWVPTIEP